jgi:hypothetical protein
MVGGARSFQCLRSGQLPFMRPGKHPWWWVTRTSRQAYVIGSVWLAFSVSLLVQFVESDVHRGWFKWFSLGAGL